MVNAASGSLITADGRSIVNDDPEGKDFPWVPKPFLEVIGGSYLKKVDEKEEGLKEAIQGKVIGLYFSAHWVSSCIVSKSVYTFCVLSTAFMCRKSHIAMFN